MKFGLKHTAAILQELLTVKSDDVEGRTKIYESMVKGENTPKPALLPVSTCSQTIRGLALNIIENDASNQSFPFLTNTQPC